MIIYWVASEYFWKPKPGAQVQSPANQSAQTQDDTKKTEETEKPMLIKSPQAIQAVELNDNITIENNLLALTFTNKGGNLKSIIVKEYYLADQEEQVQLIPENNYLTNIVLKTSEGYLDLDDLNLKYELTQQDNDQVLSFFY